MPRSCKSFVALSETLVTFKPTLSIFYATPSFFSLTLSLSLSPHFFTPSPSLSLSLSYSLHPRRLLEDEDVAACTRCSSASFIVVLDS